MQCALHKDIFLEVQENKIVALKKKASLNTCTKGTYLLKPGFFTLFGPIDANDSPMGCSGSTKHTSVLMIVDR